MRCIQSSCPPTSSSLNVASVTEEQLVRHSFTLGYWPASKINPSPQSANAGGVIGARDSHICRRQSRPSSRRRCLSRRLHIPKTIDHIGRYHNTLAGETGHIETGYFPGIFQTGPLSGDTSDADIHRPMATCTGSRKGITSLVVTIYGGGRYV